MNPNTHKSIAISKKNLFQECFMPANIHTREPIHPLEIFSGEGEVIIYTTD